MSFNLEESLRQLTDERREKLLTLIAHRSLHLVPIMENIYDQGNIGAVIRSSESFGFYKVARVASKLQKKSSRTTSGADKWIQLADFKTIEDAISHYQKLNYQIGCTVLSSTTDTIDKIDFSRPTALIFGNEKDGCSQRAKELSDFHCKIPTVGFTQSFNLSVAAAIIFYHVNSFLKNSTTPYQISPAQQEELLTHYLSQ